LLFRDSIGTFRFLDATWSFGVERLRESVLRGKPKYVALPYNKRKPEETPRLQYAHQPLLRALDPVRRQYGQLRIVLANNQLDPSHCWSSSRQSPSTAATLINV
jgi:hypothetical protein